MLPESWKDQLSLVSADDYQIMGNRIPNAVTKLPGLETIDGDGGNGGAWVTKPRRIVVTNQLPIRAHRDISSNEWRFEFDNDSLYLQLKDGFPIETEVFYVGSLNADVSPSEQDDVSQHLLEKFQCVPTFLPSDLLNKYYHGFCKHYLWPIFHYLLPMTQAQGSLFDRSNWKAYTKVNKIFADKISEVLNPDEDYVWIHDYHLMILPTFLRKRFHRIKLGFFLHSPFPSSEIYRTLPVRDEILKGFLNCDLIGFHTFDYARHFLSCCSRMLGLDYESTEIAKVVSGRTDNAVKNRFTTLCKKRAKYEAMAKENNIASTVNSNNKRILLPDGITTPLKVETESPLAKKTRRSHIPNLKEITSYGDRSHIKVHSGVNQQAKPVLLPHNATIEEHQTGERKGNQQVFLKKDDPKVTNLMQQAELLSSLAHKVNSDNTEQSMENAWKVLQDFLNKSKENDIFRCGLPEMDYQLEEFKDLVEDLRSSNEDIQASYRQPDLHDSPASSENSSGSNVMPFPSGDDTQQQPMHDSQTISQNGVELVQDKGTVSDDAIVEQQVDLLSTCHDVLKNSNEIVPMSGDEEFNSPVQVTPLFRSLAAGIPSPQFSESERSFLLKTLGVESPYPCPSANPSQPPPCKRVLLDSL